MSYLMFAQKEAAFYSLAGVAVVVADYADCADSTN
jgi:hypothetical protein